MVLSRNMKFNGMKRVSKKTMSMSKTSKVLQTTEETPSQFYESM